MAMKRTSVNLLNQGVLTMNNRSEGGSGEGVSYKTVVVAFITPSNHIQFVSIIILRAVDTLSFLWCIVGMQEISWNLPPGFIYCSS